MASVPVKREFLCEYIHGMGHNLCLILARSKEEIRERYPLFGVYGLDEQINVSPDGIERLRMYPDPGGPPDAAVADRSMSERRVFLLRRERHLASVAQLRIAAGTLGTARELQTWVDIDDDATFRMQMHDIWKDDMRYRELPPERRLF